MASFLKLSVGGVRHQILSGAGVLDYPAHKLSQVFIDHTRNQHMSQIAYYKQECESHSNVDMSLLVVGLRLWLRAEKICGKLNCWISALRTGFNNLKTNLLSWFFKKTENHIDRWVQDHDFESSDDGDEPSELTFQQFFFSRHLPDTPLPVHHTPIEQIWEEIIGYAPDYYDIFPLPAYLEPMVYDDVPILDHELLESTREFEIVHKSYKIIEPTLSFGTPTLEDYYFFPDFFPEEHKAPTKLIIQNTAFPRLGFEHLDACDCWLPDPSRDMPFPRQIMLLLFGKSLLQPVLLLNEKAWLLKRVPNGTNIVCKLYDDTFFIYEAKDCHLVEGQVCRDKGHLFIEKTVIRNQQGFNVIKHTHSDYLHDLSDLLVDQHAHVATVRTFIQPISQSISGPSTIIEDSKPIVWKYRGDTRMPAEEKARQRRERRKLAKTARANGVKPERWQVPIRFKGLTTMEYHEAVRREQDDLVEWLQQQGRKALPQSVREWLSSPSGSKQWHDVHAYAVLRPEFAQSQLDKINKYLMTIGLRVPLTINPNIVANMTKQKKRQEALREAQLIATGKRPSHFELAHNKKIRDDLDIVLEGRSETLQKPGGWADETDDDMYFDRPPDWG